MKMRSIFSLVIVLCVMSILNVTTSHAQGFSSWGLPEGAEARLGKGIIKSIAYSPDGSRLAVGTSMGIWIYDAATGEELSLLGAHTGVVASIAYSRDGKMLVSAHNAHGRKNEHRKSYVALWDVATGTLIKTLSHTRRDWDYIAPIYSVAFSPDSTRIAVGDDLGGLLWDVVTGTLISTLDNNPSINSVTFSPDGKTIASGHRIVRFPALAIWDGVTGEFKKTFHPTKRGIRNVVYSPDGTILACATTDGRVILWDVAASLPIDTFVVFEGNTPNVVAYSPDGKTITVGAARKVSIWDAATGRRRHLLSEHIDDIRGIAYSPDSRTVATGGDDGTVRFWNVSTGAIRHTITGHTDEVNAVAYSLDGNTLAIGGAYSVNTVGLWEVATNTLKNLLEIDTTDFGWSSVDSLAFSPDGSTIAGGNYQETYLWDAATHKIRHRLEGSYRSRGLTYSPDGSTIAGGISSGTVALSPDSTKLVTPGGGLSGDTMANLWDVTTGKIVKSFTLTELSSGDALIVWDVTTRRIVDKLPLAPEDGYVRDIKYSPDGNTVAAAVGSSVYLWDATIGRLKYRLTDDPLDKNHEKFMSVAFSPDGSTLASGGGFFHRTVLLWDVKTGTLKSTLRGHSDAVVSLTYSPDGTVLASGSHDGTVLLWHHIHSAALPPVFTEGSSATRTIAENTAAGVNIGAPVAATDADDDTLTYTLSGADAAAFSIDPTTGQLRTRAALDYETKSTYTVTVTVSDGTFTSTLTVTIGVTDIDEIPPNRAPVFTDGTSTTHTIAESTAAGVNIGTPVAATDADNDALTYTLSGADAAAFSIDSTTGQLRTRAALDYETKSTYTVTITVSDGSLTDTIAVTINITNIDETPVDSQSLIVSLSPSPLQSPAVGERLTLDLDIANGTDVAGYQATVQFDATALRYISSTNADYLPPGVLMLPTVATENTVTILVPPTYLDKGSNGNGTLATLTFEVVAAKASTVKLSEVLLTDSTGKVLTPQVEDGQITELTEPQPLIADVNGDSVVSIQDLVLVATSFGQTGENAADVNGDGKVDLTDLVLVAGAVGKAAETPETTNNAPVFTEDDSTTRTVEENVAAGVNIGTPITATDADDDTLTYSLSGTDADTFSIDTTTGQLRTRGALDYETKFTYTVTVAVSDGSLTDTITVTISITDIDETPVDAQDIIVSLSPSPVQSPAVGEQLTLNLNIANGKDIVGYQVTVQFDATALRYISSANADYLPAGTLALPAVVTENSVMLVATSFAGGSDGDGTLATITFKVVAAKASTIRLTSVTLSDSAANLSQVTSTDGIVTGAAAVDLVSGRTPQVQDAIVSAAGVGSAAEVTAAHLAAIEQLDLNNTGITALKASDFDGFTGLTGLDLGGNDFNTELLQDIFDKLTSLIVLILPDNNATAQLIEKFGGQVFSLRSDDFIVQPNELQGTMILFKVPSPPTVAGAVGDVNLDGTVNIQDLVHVIRNFGKTGENIADTNDDGVVDIADLVNVVGSFGQLSNAAPSLSSKVVTSLTRAEVEELLTQIRKLDLTNPMVQQWISTLEHLLAALTPKETALLANYPNPFNPETWIPYQLATPADVTLRIHAVDGTLVRTLSLGYKAVGTYQTRSRAAYWDGKNDLGEPVASGVYFYTLTAGDFTATRKMLTRK